jgi:hypothetical protein
MSTEAVESVLSRAMSDAAFADTLFANAEKALSGFDLTGEEVEKFKGLSRADFDTLMASPEERKSFSYVDAPKTKISPNININQIGH